MIEVINRTVPPLRRPGARPKYPWLEMAPGQAFKFPAGTKFASATSMASSRGFDYTMKFAVRREGDELWCYRVDGLAKQPASANFREIIETVEREPRPASEVAVVGQETDDRRHEWANADDEV